MILKSIFEFTILPCPLPFWWPLPLTWWVGIVICLCSSVAPAVKRLATPFPFLWFEPFRSCDLHSGVTVTVVDQCAGPAGGGRCPPYFGEKQNQNVTF